MAVAQQPPVRESRRRQARTPAEWPGRQHVLDLDDFSVGEIEHVFATTDAMKEILAQLSKYPIKTRLSLTGPMIVARDLAHSKLRERLRLSASFTLESGLRLATSGKGRITWRAVTF